MLTESLQPAFVWPSENRASDHQKKKKNERTNGETGITIPRPNGWVKTKKWVLLETGPDGGVKKVIK